MDWVTFGTLAAVELFNLAIGFPRVQPTVVKTPPAIVRPAEAAPVEAEPAATEPEVEAEPAPAPIATGAGAAGGY